MTEIRQMAAKEIRQMVVIAPDRTRKTYQWNGVVEDQDAARAIFDEKMCAGGYMAFTVDKTTKKAKDQIRSFTVEEDIVVAPQLVGG